MKSIMPAMQEATRLIRARDLAGATRLIQQALNGGGSAPEPEADRTTHRLLDGPGAAARHSEGAGPARDARSARTRKPLGEALDLLRTFKPPRIDLGGLPLTRRPQPPVPDGAAYLVRSFSCAAGSRDYTLYAPSRMKEKPALIVMLHGCTQNADDFAVGTRMNQLAEEGGFIVVYPEQSPGANSSMCWNWFDRAHQMRGVGEPSIIAGLTQSVIEEFGVDADRVFVAGLSAGGAMAVVLGETYPDLYAATGVHSGLAFGVAADVVSAFAAMRGPVNLAQNGQPKARSGASNAARAIIFHGAEDQKVHPSNGGMIFSDARSSLVGGARLIEQDDAQGGRAFRRTLMVDLKGHACVEHWEIEGLGHAWSGGDPKGSHADRHGPDASREMLRFFLEPKVERGRT
jgi:poly(hydroxyalkanoate) depolymerase family esterase